MSPVIMRRTRLDAILKRIRGDVGKVTRVQSGETRQHVGLVPAREVGLLVQAGAVEGYCRDHARERRGVVDEEAS